MTFRTMRKYVLTTWTICITFVRGISSANTHVYTEAHTHTYRGEREERKKGGRESGGIEERRKRGRDGGRQKENSYFV